MKILITGSSGMLGQELIRAALNANCEAIGLHQNIRDGEFETSLSIPQILCDITNAEAIETIASVSPDVIVHAAAHTNVDECERDPDMAWRVNVIGTENVAKAAVKCGAIFFYISTDYVFDGINNSPYIEADHPNPISVYGRSKLKGEESVRSLCKKFFIVRTAWMFGERRANFVSKVVDFAKKGGNLIAWVDQKSSPTYSKDIANAIMHMISKIDISRDNIFGANEIYHITNSGSCSRCDMTKKVLELCGSPNRMPRLVKLSEAGCIAPRPMMSALDNSKYNAVFGKPMRTWSDAVEEYVEGLLHRSDKRGL